MTTLRLMCITAHPDDESLGLGGVLAKYGADGVATYVLCATRGERGWTGAAQTYPGPAALGRLRERELREACGVLGVRRVDILDYVDGDLDRANADQVIADIAAHLRHVQPQVVISFAPDGATGHPDHIAISQYTTAAIVRAAAPEDLPHCSWPAYQVVKLYYLVASPARLAAYEAVFGDSAMTVDGVTRRVAGWPPWAITTRISTVSYWSQVWRAIRCHRSQLPSDEGAVQVRAELHRDLWDTQELYRAFSMVNGGRAVEPDVFAGLR